jgi:preprotein translocase subunit SecE
MAKTNIFDFVQDVRNEATKVTWPSRKEAMVTTALVVLMAVVTSIFFVVVDQVIRAVVGVILGIGR